MKIILASASPRRKEILSKITTDFEIIVSDAEEILNNESAKEAVLKLSQIKAEDVCKKVNFDAIVIGADTVVSLDDKILGKPKNEADAIKMLKNLSGNIHYVYTGVTIIRTSDNKKITFCEGTKVIFDEMTDSEIEYYVNTKEPMDKAGAYGIQGVGGLYIKAIEGDYNNVVGLPLCKLYKCLKNEFQF